MPSHVKNMKNRKQRRAGVTRSEDATTDIPWPRYSVPDPFPTRRAVTLTYTDSKTLTAGASGTFGTEIGYRLNSLYDPDYVSTGHQPYFYDTLTSIYQRYLVLACTVDVTLSDPSADGVCVGVAVKPNSATGSNTNLYLSTPDIARERPNTVCVYVNNTGGQKAHIRRRFAIWEVEGMRRRDFDGAISQYSALYSASPTLNPYLQAAAAALDGSSTPTIRCQIKLEFEVVMWERTIVAQS